MALPGPAKGLAVKKKGSQSFDARPDAGSGSALLEELLREALREVHDVDRVSTKLYSSSNRKVISLLGDPWRREHSPWRREHSCGDQLPAMESSGKLAMPAYGCAQCYGGVHVTRVTQANGVTPGVTLGGWSIFVVCREPEPRIHVCSGSEALWRGLRKVALYCWWISRPGLRPARRVEPCGTPPLLVFGGCIFSSAAMWQMNRAATSYPQWRGGQRPSRKAQCPPFGSLRHMQRGTLSTRSR